MKKFTSSLFTLLLSFSISGQGYEWAQSQAAAGGDHTAANGNHVYVQGRISAVTTFGTQTLDPANGLSFLAKYNSSGAFQWILQLDSVDVSDLACDAGHVYFSARFGPDAHIGSTLIPGGNNWDALLAKIDAAGNIVFMRTGTSPSDSEMGHSVDVDNSGNIYFTGWFNGNNAAFGTAAYTGNYGLETMFLIKYDASGNIIWGKTVTSDDGSCTGDFVRVNSSTGDIYLIADTFGDSLYFDAMYFYAGSYPVEVIVKYTSSGTATHMQIVNTGYQSIVRDMEIDGSGNVYTLQTNYNMDFTLAKRDAGLNDIWDFIDGGGAYISVTSLEIDQMNRPVVAAFFGGNITVGGQPLSTPSSVNNSFFAYYNTSGSLNHLKEIEGNVDLRSISLDNAGNMYLTGEFYDNASFDAVTLTSPGQTMFLAKYAESTPTAVISAAAAGFFRVYPNPNNGRFICELPLLREKEVLIEIFNMLGEKTGEKKIQGGGTLHMDLAMEKKGIYTLKMTVDGAVTSQRIIVQ